MGLELITVTLSIACAKLNAAKVKFVALVVNFAVLQASTLLYKLSACLGCFR